MSASDSQRRSNLRFAKHFVVRYRSMLEQAWRVSTLRDVSKTGARLFCEEAFAPHVSIMLEIGLPVFEKPLQIPARVAWCKPKTSGRIGMAEHGVIFSADTNMKAMIEAAIERVAKEKNPHA